VKHCVTLARKICTLLSIEDIYKCLKAINSDALLKN